MRIPRFWDLAGADDVDRKGEMPPLTTWGWSFTSVEDAKLKAQERLKSAIARLKRGDDLRKEYYLENPIREEIVETVKHGDKEIALITRNRYGSLVLNTASVLFADVDFPKETADVFTLLACLFSSKKQKERNRERTLLRVRNWMQANPNRSLRLYQTAGGLRLLFTDKLYIANGAETVALFDSLGVDPLYRKLTTKQECFRARLTPKPRRCQCEHPPGRFPWFSKDDENRYRQWELKYSEAAKDYCTCQLIIAHGSESMAPEIASIVQLHDKYCCDKSSKALA